MWVVSWIHMLWIVSSLDLRSTSVSSPQIQELFSSSPSLCQGDSEYPPCSENYSSGKWLRNQGISVFKIWSVGWAERYKEPVVCYTDSAELKWCGSTCWEQSQASVSQSSGALILCFPSQPPFLFLSSLEFCSEYSTHLSALKFHDLLV